MHRSKAQKQRNEASQSGQVLAWASHCVRPGTCIPKDKLYLPESVMRKWLGNEHVCNGFKTWLDDFTKTYEVLTAADAARSESAETKRKAEKDAMLASPVKKAKASLGHCDDHA